MISTHSAHEDGDACRGINELFADISTHSAHEDGDTTSNDTSVFTIPISTHSAHEDGDIHGCRNAGKDK